MGARAIKAVDRLALGCRLALAGSLAAAAIGYASGWGLEAPLEVAIARTLSDVAPAETLNARALAAIEVEDVDLARGYADLAAELKRPLPAVTLARLEAAEAPGATALRAARGVARGFATGAADSPAALGGALAADFTVVGDLRDLAGEGMKLARGEEANELILGLAAVGVAATAATLATASLAAPAKAGVSILKAARRTGALTAEFAADLGRRMTRTGGRGLDAARAAPGAAAADAGRGATGIAAVAGVATELRAVSAAAGGPAETVRLMRFVRSVDDLPELRRFSARFGKQTRAVAEVTGKASLRAFRVTIRVGELLMKHLLGVLMWVGGLLAGAVSNLGWRGARLVAARA
jgi:hypothetical protein